MSDTSTVKLTDFEFDVQIGGKNADNPLQDAIDNLLKSTRTIAPFATDENKHREAALGQLMKTEFQGHTLHIPKADARTGKRSVMKVEG